MPSPKLFTRSRAMAVAGLLAGPLLGSPSLAEAQARGTLQVTAVVVSNGPALDGLRSAQAAAQHWLGSKPQNQSTVSTLASVTVTASPAVPGVPERTLVVTVDYPRN